jgi:hypothetical protein
MNTTAINRTLDLGLLWAFALLAGSGLVMEYRLAGEYHLPTGATILGLGWSGWALLHLVMGYAMLGLVAGHIVLHWRWIWTAAVVKRSLPIIGVLVVAGLLAVAPLFAPLQLPAGADRR